MSKVATRHSKRQSLAALATFCAKEKTGGVKNNETRQVACTLQNVNTTEMQPLLHKDQPSNADSVNTMDARNNSSDLPNDDFRLEPVKKKRGKTMMKIFYSKPNEKPEVEFNDRGQPIGLNSKHLSSYLGTIAREMVPVTIPEWKKVDKELRKDIWACIQV